MLDPIIRHRRDGSMIIIDPAAIDARAAATKAGAPKHIRNSLHDAMRAWAKREGKV